MTPRRLLTLALHALVTAVLVLLVGATAAAAAPASPGIPGIPDCKEAPAPQTAGYGIAGVLDPAPKPLPEEADPFTGDGSIYDQYGYAGLRWATYDLGCGGSVRDPGAAADTMMGNAFFGMAVTLTAATNGIHNTVAQPDKYMQPLDKVVKGVSQTIHDSIWSPWGGVALLGVVALLLVYSLRGQLSTAASAAAWAVLVLAVLAGVGQYPTRASTFFDDVVTSTIGEVQASTAGVVVKSDSARAQGALTVDRVLYDAWLRGELGSTDSPAAKRWGPALFKSSTISWHEAKDAGSAQERKALLEKKSDQWQDTAEEIEEEDPSAYQTLQGKAGGRAGTGFMAFVGTLFTSGFRLIADIFLLVGLVMLRLLVMFLPAAAVVGILAPMSSILRRMANIGGAAVINVVAFAVGAAVHTTAISAVLESAEGVGMTLMALMLCIVLTLAALILMWPLLSFRLAFGSGDPGRGPNLRRVGRQVASYVVTKDAVEDGIEDASKHGKQHTPEAHARPARPTPAERPRRTAPSAPGGLDEDAGRIYRSAAPTDDGSARRGGQQSPHDQPTGGAGQRSTDRSESDAQRSDSVLVGSTATPHGNLPPRGAQRRKPPSRPARRPTPVRIYDPATKRTTTFRDSESTEV